MKTQNNIYLNNDKEIRSFTLKDLLTHLYGKINRFHGPKPEDITINVCDCEKSYIDIIQTRDMTKEEEIDFRIRNLNSEQKLLLLRMLDEQSGK